MVDIGNTLMLVRVPWKNLRLMVVMQFNVWWDGCHAKEFIAIRCVMWLIAAYSVLSYHEHVITRRNRNIKYRYQSSG